MLKTPCRESSLREHQKYYSQIRPRVDCRWKSGTPLGKTKKVVNKERRMADSSLLGVDCNSPLKNIKTAVKDMENADDVLDASPEKKETSEGNCDVSGSSDHDSPTTTSSSRQLTVSSISIVAHTFDDLFVEVNRYMSRESSTEVNRTYVKRQMSEIKDTINTIDYLISTVISKFDLLERFLIQHENN